MLTLYHLPQSRSGNVIWLMEELDVPYEIKKVATIRRPDGSGARDPDNPHPHGKVPCLVHDGQRIFEIAAITLYLTDAFPEKKMAPLVGEKGRGEYLSWLAWRPGVLEPAMLARRFGVKHVFGAMGWAPAEEVEDLLNETLSQHPFLLGDAFSAADITVGGAVGFLMQFKILNETPILKEYITRISARPALQRAMERDASA